MLPPFTALPRYGQTEYRRAPPAVAAILDSQPTPPVSVSPAGEGLLLIQGVRYPPIADLPEPMLRLAGLRINPRTNGPHRPPRHTGFTLLSLPDGRERRIATPAAGYPGYAFVVP